MSQKTEEFSAGSQECKKGQKALQKEARILKELINGAENMHLVFLDRDFNFVRVNEAYARTCGYKPEEMIGKNHFVLYPDEEVEAIFKRVRDAGVPATFHDRPFVFPDQPERGVTYWDWTLKPVKGGSGKVEGLVFSLVETTERKKMEEKLKESEERFFKAFQHNPTPMAISFTDGAFMDVNSSFERLTGFTRDEVIGKRGADLGLYGSASEREELIRKLQRHGHVYNFPMTFTTKSMKRVNVLFSVERIRLQNKPRVLGTAVDITEKQQLQNELEKYSRNLKELVRLKTEQLREKERLAAIGQTAGMVGHDIRNPLQAIMGDLYLIASEASVLSEGEIKETIKESVREMRKSVEYIDKIVQDLQDYAKSLKPNVQKTNFEKTCQELLLKNRFPENIKAKYVVEDDVREFVTDPTFLKRILSNLVDNAVQAMPDGGKLLIQAVREADDVVISVQDSGAGVPEEYRDKLFMPLFTTKAKGQGFGLPVVKRMTEALGGTVTFESEAGKGTKFIVRLPVVRR